jgi:predicted MPP superfamily phosphohydrolase
MSIYHAPNIISRVVLLSDLHMDYIANREWLTNLYNNNDDNYNNNNDNKLLHLSSTLIIIAGDISHNLDVLRWTFITLKSKFAQVVYTPGNHELWVTNNNNNNNTVDQDYNNTETLLDKLAKVLELCIQEGIHIGPVRVSSGTTALTSTASSVLVIPLLSWHHPSFDTELDIIGCCNKSSARRANSDYRQTCWPLPLSHFHDSVAEFVDDMNDIILDLENINDNNNDNNNIEIITFSHFLP